jgi:hypothetical protein
LQQVVKLADLGVGQIGIGGWLGSGNHGGFFTR